NDFKDIEKTFLVSLLEKDNLKLEEIDIWNCVIQWGIGQIENLEEEDISEWSDDDFENLRNVLKDIFPLIRFDQISLSDFHDKLIPYDKIFNKEIYEDLIHYHLNNDNDWKPNLLVQKGPRTGKSLLNLRMKLLISSWIDEKNEDDFYNENDD